METTTFNASELCSRKLWQLVNSTTEESVETSELKQAISELAARRHYLAELSRMGKLGDTNHNA